MDTEKHEEHNADQPVHSQGAVSFSLPSAREVLSELRSTQLDPDDARRKAIASSLAEYERQLNSIESLYRVQTSLATEFGLHGALAEGCADAVGNVAELAADPHAAAAAMPDVFSVTDDFMDREHVRALAYQAGCPQEAVRKELRAFQKTAADRVRLAAKRTKASGQEPLPVPAAGVRSTPSFRSASPANAIPSAAGAAPHRPPSKQSPPPQQQQQQQQQQPTRAAARPVMDERLYSWDEAEEAARKAQLTKLGGLLNPDTGGICKEPISTVGVFQQQMPSCLDWRVRRLALEAMSRSSLDVLWRLMQNSKVLDSLHTWVQEAQADQQITMMELMLETMACLPMPRYLLKGSRLEAALEGLAGGGRHGGGAAAAAVDDGSPHASIRRFGDAAAAVLTEWRNDPDQATIMRRAGGVVPDAPVVAVARISVPAQAAATAIPGSRLLGAAAAKDVMRKRALSISRAQSEARPAARPRAADAGGGNAAPAGGAGVGANGSIGGGGANGITAGSGGGGGLQSAPKRGSLASAAPPRPVKGAVDMTAKLGEKGPADPDVVAGFRSRFGDGSVRRSQLARPARAAVAATAPPTAATVREPSPGPVPPAAPAPAAPGAAGAAAAHTRQPGAAEAGSTGGDAVAELGPEGLARLRAERAAQRQTTALLALQAEARRHPEIAAAEAELRERQRAKREALRVEEQGRWVAPEELRRRLQAMRETVPWTGPPPEFRVLPDETLAGTGEESTERLERAQERERVPKVSYPRPERIPDSPAEPATQQQHQQQPPPRPLPWAPLSDTEEGAIDWFRQNLGLWERGMRRAEFVLPPFLLHKHLELAPDLLPPLLAAPPQPQPPQPQPAATPGASAASVTLPGQPPSFGPPHLHPSQPQPHRHSHSHRQQAPPEAPPAATVMRQHMVSDAPPAAAAGAVAAAAGLVETDWRGPPPPQQHHRPQLAPLPPPPPLMPVVTAWERPAEPGQLLLSEPAPVVVLNVTSAPPPTYVVPLMTMPTAAPLQPQSHTQAQPQLQPPVQVPYGEGPYGHVNGHSAPAPVPAPGPWQQQPPTDERAPYGYAGNGELPPHHAKLGRPQLQPSYQQPQQYHHPPPAAYQQPEPAQSHHHRHDMHAPYGHRQNGHGGDGGPGDYGSGQYPHQEQQRPAYHGGWQESRGYQQPREYGGRG